MILAWVLLNRLIPAITDDNLLKSQCSFQVVSRTTDLVFVWNQILKNARNKIEMYATFVDLTKHLISGTGLDLRGSKKNWTFPWNFSQYLSSSMMAQSAGAAEYTDYIYAEG